MLNFKKALPLRSAFFVACFLVFGSSYAACPVIKGYEAVDVRKVYDGDTVLLSDGRRIRLIGINTPEMGRDGNKDEPYATEAKAYLNQLLSSGRVGLVLGKEKRDRHQRWLGHLLVDGQLVSEQMLVHGLAFQVAIKPNTTHWSCLKEAEREATSLARGFWSSKVWKSVDELKRGEGGFRLVEGKITAARKKGAYWLLDIDEHLRIKVSEQAMPNRLLNGKAVGQNIKVRGWLKAKGANSPKHFKPWFLSIGHKVHIQ